MLREEFSNQLKTAMHAKDSIKLQTIRMIIAAMKEKDIEERAKDNPNGASEETILGLLQTLIKKRNDSVKIYEEAGRKELAIKEKQEIEIIQTFLPQQLSEKDANQAIENAVSESGASEMRDMGKVMAILKQKYSGQMDFSKVSQQVKSHLQ